MKRKIFYLLLVLVMFSFSAQARLLKPIQLWKTHIDSGKTFLETIQEQKCEYISYSRNKLPMQMISDLLWSAEGYNYNNPDRKLISAFEVQKIDIYVAMELGFYIYDPIEHVLNPKEDEDIRWLTGNHDYVKDAPITLIYVADYSKNLSKDREKSLMLASARAAMIAQNVSLFCAAFDLYTALRMNIDHSNLSEVLKLDKDHEVLFVQTVGESLIVKKYK